MRHLPIFDLRLETPRLTLQTPDLARLDALGDAAARGIFEEGSRIRFQWYLDDPPARAREVVQYNLRILGEATPERFVLPLVVSRDGEVVGVQSLIASELSLTREVKTGSWLALSAQGQGLGTEMRAAALVLARSLGAHVARTEALVENLASQRVSERLGYRPDGTETIIERGEARTLLRYRLDLREWEPPCAVTCAGLEPVRELLVRSASP